MAVTIEAFRMPRYREIPDMGLYLDQTIKYINHYLAPLGCMEITSSMVSNYVKKGYIANPVRKQYNAEQIAYLFFIAIAKHVLSMENIERLCAMQKKTYSNEVAYDYFCMELENRLSYIFGLKKQMETVGTGPNTEQKSMLRSVINAVANIIYLNDCFDHLEDDEPKPSPDAPQADT